MTSNVSIGGVTVDVAGKALPDRKFREAWATDGSAVTLDQAKLPLIQAKLKRRIDDDAEAVRLQHITPGYGMGLTYREKFAQAQSVYAAGEAAANAMTVADRVAAYPTLAASVGIEAPTLWECAALVITRFATFAQLSYVIESRRLGGKKAVGDAKTIEAAQSAYEAVSWKT